MWKNGLPHIAGGNVVHLLWKNLKVSLKIKHITTLGLSKCTSRHLSQRNENLCPHKHLHMNAYSSFTQSSPRCPSMGKYLNKLWYNQYYGIGLDNEKETPSDACNNLGKSPENDAEKNPI